jgi:hypothetical protein
LRIQSLAAGNRYYAVAVARVPGYAQACAVAAEAQQRLRELPAAAAELRSPLETGRIGDEWVQAAVDAQILTAATDARRRILTELRDLAHGTVTSAVNIHADLMLSALHDALAGLIDRGRMLCEVLDGARTPAEAISTGADAAKAWAGLAEIVAGYRQIRAAQAAVMVEFVEATQAAKSPRNLDPRASDLLLANLDQVCPGWRTPGLDYSGASLWTPPWPGDDTEYLVWLCTSAAAAWVPTLAELEGLWQQRKPALDAVQTAPAPVGNGVVRVINGPVRRVPA